LSQIQNACSAIASTDDKVTIRFRWCFGVPENQNNQSKNQIGLLKVSTLNLKLIRNIIMAIYNFINFIGSG